MNSVETKRNPSNLGDKKSTLEAATNERLEIVREILNPQNYRLTIHPTVGKNGNLEISWGFPSTQEDDIIDILLDNLSASPFQTVKQQVDPNLRAKHPIDLIKKVYHDRDLACEKKLDEILDEEYKEQFEDQISRDGVKELGLKKTSNALNELITSHLIGKSNFFSPQCRMYLDQQIRLPESEQERAKLFSYFQDHDHPFKIMVPDDEDVNIKGQTKRKVPLFKQYFRSLFQQFEITKLDQSLGNSLYNFFDGIVESANNGIHNPKSNDASQFMSWLRNNKLQREISLAISSMYKVHNFNSDSLTAKASSKVARSSAAIKAVDITNVSNVAVESFLPIVEMNLAAMIGMKHDIVQNGELDQRELNEFISSLPILVSAYNMRKLADDHVSKSTRKDKHFENKTKTLEYHIAKRHFGTVDKEKFEYDMQAEVEFLGSIQKHLPNEWSRDALEALLKYDSVEEIAHLDKKTKAAIEIVDAVDYHMKFYKDFIRSQTYLSSRKSLLNKYHESIRIPAESSVRIPIKDNSNIWKKYAEEDFKTERVQRAVNSGVNPKVLLENHAKIFGKSLDNLKNAFDSEDNSLTRFAPHELNCDLEYFDPQFRKKFVVAQRIRKKQETSRTVNFPITQSYISSKHFCRENLEKLLSIVINHSICEGLQNPSKQYAVIGELLEELLVHPKYAIRGPNFVPAHNILRPTHNNPLLEPYMHSAINQNAKRNVDFVIKNGRAGILENSVMHNFAATTARFNQDTGLMEYSGKTDGLITYDGRILGLCKMKGQNGIEQIMPVPLVQTDASGEMHLIRMNETSISYQKAAINLYSDIIQPVSEELIASSSNPERTYKQLKPLIDIATLNKKYAMNSRIRVA